MVSKNILEKYQKLKYEIEELIQEYGIKELEASEPEKEIQLKYGEVAVFCDVLDFLSEFTGISKFNHTNASSFRTINDDVWTYAIKFSDFNPENMEETKKHILCVKNGKIIRYKE